MSKPPKLFQLANKRQLIVRDQKAQRIILGIGRKRTAFDFFTCITRLPPHTGDQPAAVLLMKKKPK